ncbi:MAG TPA: dUTP diphosphatase [Clostridiales bacterium]|nr:dUTP diphosphatase [Clostridiales bacterium]
MITVKFLKLRPGARMPAYATLGSAAADLFACLDDTDELDGLAVDGGTIVIPAGGRVSIPTGIAIEPIITSQNTESADSFVALIFGRSGLGAKYGITLANSVGVVDSDYRGEIKVALINHSNRPYAVSHGDRIAQIAFVPVASAKFIEACSLGETERGGSGFGSTGK